MTKIVIYIKHTAESSEVNPSFLVYSDADFEHANIITLTPPSAVPLVGHDTVLSVGLRWYLEEYLVLPIKIYQNRAESIQITMKNWGLQCFQSLFIDQHLSAHFSIAQKADLENLSIRIISSAPAILAWPWEALYNKELGYIAQYCQIERQIPNTTTLQLIEELPKNSINILYIIARPLGKEDIDYQTLARPLVDFVDKGKWPVKIDLLRPPTFDKLCETLRKKPNFYHIVHFDGHGIIQSHLAEQFPARCGSLVFETEVDGGLEGEAITADRIGSLLNECNVPYVVLNACQSAAMDEDSNEPFSAVAASLLKSGIHGIIAMSYSLWVGGAKAFVPAFYRQLFEHGEMGKAIQAGRQSMYHNNQRDTIVGTTEFFDWVVPVFYRQRINCFNLPILVGKTCTTGSGLPEEIQKLTRESFIGRSTVIQQLDRAMQCQSQAAILIHGLAGEGKTTLAKGYLQWLSSTGGLENGALWFNFEGIYSADYIIEILADTLLGLQVAQSKEHKLSAIIDILRVTPFVMVWDNFESASIFDAAPSRLTNKDREVLKYLLDKLYDGMAKVLITSRSAEEWLSERDCFRIRLNGLQGEEVWQYCNMVIKSLGLTINRNASDYWPLIDKLDGNPLAIRVILMQMKNRKPNELLKELDAGFDKIESNSDSERMQRIIQIFDNGLDATFAPVLKQLGLHENFAVPILIEAMLEDSISCVSPLIDECFNVLTDAGLCHPLESDVYKLHPVMYSYLAKLYPADNLDKQVFVEVMCEMISKYTPLELHDQYGAFTMMGASFRHALSHASELNMIDSEIILIQGLAAYAENMRNFSEAEELFLRQADVGKRYNRTSAEAGAYHRLGSLACMQQNYDIAYDWYNRALQLFIKDNDERGIAQTYHQLGIVAYFCGNLDEAENWYKKSLDIESRQGDEVSIAQTYHQLGDIAYERRNYDEAEHWYKQSLTIELKHNDEYGTAGTYHSLGAVLLMKKNYEAAENYYRLSKELKLKYDDDYGATGAYHGLGRVAEALGNFEDAEDCYKQCISILLRYDDKYRLAISYGQLGSLSVAQKDYVTAEKWYKESLPILEEINDVVDADIVRENLINLRILLEDNTQSK